MKKRVFYQLNLWIIIVEIIIFSIPASGVYLIISMIINDNITNENWWIIPITSFAIILFSVGALNLAKHKVVIDENGVFAPADWQTEGNKVQYKTTVFYEDIEKFAIIRSAKNSKNQPLDERRSSSHLLKPYLEFKLKGGNTERIYIQFFTKRQWAKIVDEIKLRLANSGNNIAVEDTMKMIKKADTRTCIDMDN